MKGDADQLAMLSYYLNPVKLQTRGPLRLDRTREGHRSVAWPVAPAGEAGASEHRGPGRAG